MSLSTPTPDNLSGWMDDSTQYTDHVNTPPKERPEDVEFLPASRIDYFTSPDIINGVLSHAGLPNTRELTRYILKEPTKKRLFLIAVDCNKLEWLAMLPGLPTTLSDDDLPVYQNKRRRRQVTIHSMKRALGEGKIWPMQNWSDNDKAMFCDRQWRFLAPIFAHGMFHHVLHQLTPLPLLMRDYKAKGDGSFSRVFKAKIDKSHQDIVPIEDSENLYVALKVMFSGDVFFNRELEVLERIRFIDHPHLIKPMGSYKNKNECCFLFPWADKGSLKDVWGMPENQYGVVHNRDHVKMMWTMRQMEGLCAALVEMHKDRPSTTPGSHQTVHCRHGDLKPENILLFSNERTETLCIADIGLGKFHNKDTYFRQKGHIYTDTKTGTSRYLPPEFHKDKQISRLFDVWSLGCLYLEFVIWAMWGSKGLDQFLRLNIPEFWQATNGENQGIVHFRIEKWIREMESILSLGNRTTAFGDLLNLITTSMLKKKEDRCTSKQVLKSLKKIVDKAQVDTSYCLDERLQARVRVLPQASSTGATRNNQEYVC